MERRESVARHVSAKKVEQTTEGKKKTRNTKCNDKGSTRHTREKEDRGRAKCAQQNLEK